MLFMVVERFGPGVIEKVGERFRENGRMLPDDVTYVASWLSPGGLSCYQLMEAPTRESLQPWIDRWSDLMDVEITPVQTSVDYWASRT